MMMTAAEREFKCVFTAEMAKELLRLGYTIVDLKPDKYDPEGKRSIFIFRNEAGLMETIKRLAGIED